MKEFHVLNVFPFLSACGNPTVGLPCHSSTVGIKCPDNSMCRCGQGVLVPLVHKVCECIDEMRMYWLLEWSFFDPVRLVVAMERSAEIDWTGLGSLDR